MQLDGRDHLVDTCSLSIAKPAAPAFVDFGAVHLLQRYPAMPASI